MRIQLCWSLIPVLGIIFLSSPIAAFGQNNPTTLAGNPVTVNVAVVTETRGEIIAPDHHPYVAALNPPELTVILQVIGKVLKDPHYFYNTQISTADLNDGVALRFLDPGAGILNPVDSPLYRQMVWAGELGFPVPLNFATTPLTAKWISHIQGSFDVIAGGKTKEIQIDEVGNMSGQTVAQPDLAQAGITLQILSVPAQNMLVLKASSPPGAIESVAVMRNGAAINSGYILSRLSDSTSQIMIPLSHTPDAQTELILHVLSGQSTIHVPFDLQNIPLPR